MLCCDVMLRCGGAWVTTPGEGEATRPAHRERYEANSLPTARTSMFGCDR
jgi:hypothetical protein